MNLTTEQLQSVIEMDLQEAYEFFLICKEENEKLEQDYDEIRYGINLEIDIHDIIDGNILVKPKQQKVRILTGTDTFSLDEYRTELENRKSRIKKAILENMEEKNSVFKRMNEEEKEEETNE